MSKNKLPDSDEQDDEKVSRDTLQVVSPSLKSDSPGMVLASGTPVFPFRQALPSSTNAFIARRSWLMPLLAILVAVAGYHSTGFDDWQTD